MIKKRHFLLAVVGATTILVLLLSLSSIEKWLPHGGNMILPRIEKLFADTKVICYGRFLIDVPQEAEVIYGPSHLPWPLTSYPGKGPQIEDIIAARMAEVTEEKKLATGH